MRNFHYPGRSTVHTKEGMVATSHPIAAGVALESLKNGGNAVDAALAAALVMPLCEPHMTGLYGDMFALVKDKGQSKIFGLNASGKSPKNIAPASERLKGLQKIPLNSPIAITLPGAISGFEVLANNHSNLGLTAACEPAIHYAQEGIPVAPRVAFDWSKNAHVLSGCAREYYLINGRPPSAGEIFKFPMQAELLKIIAKNGAQGFYEGEVAEDIITSLKKLGGTHSFDDLRSVSCDYVKPLSANYGNVELIELPPNGQGATAILLGKILSNFKLKDLNPFGAERTHLEAEASKLAYAMRDQFIGDPEFSEESIHKFLSDDNAFEIAKLIDRNKVKHHRQKKLEESHTDTILITVIDRDRCSISLIFSIFHPFGSGLASERFGLLFHNRGAGFTLKENHPNSLIGNRRPMHTIIPAMAREKGKFFLCFGVMGGQYQPVGHIRLLSNLVDYGMDLQEAIDGPRAFADEDGLKLEDGYNNAIAQSMQDLGHEVVRTSSPLGGAQAILLDTTNDTLIGASDPRKDGLAIGY